MENTFYIEVELETRPEPVEIEVTTEGIWENDGIGAYEYWGQKCYDRGTDYFTIETWDWDKTGFTPEEIATVESAIEAKAKDWSEEVQPAEPDYPDRDE
jgi:hypothetical protein